MASEHIRASDRDRDAVVAALRDAFAEGRLTLDEFQERTSAAYAGRTWGDLRELTTDLPVQPSLGADLPPQARPVDEQPAGSLPVAPYQAGPYPLGPYLPGPYPPGPYLPGSYPPVATGPDGRPAGAQVPGGLGGPGTQQASPLHPYPRQQGAQDMVPPGRQPRGRPFAPVIPVVGMWVLFALATRSAGGAVAFIIAMALLIALASVGRRPPRGPSSGGDH